MLQLMLLGLGNYLVIRSNVYFSYVQKRLIQFRSNQVEMWDSDVIVYYKQTKFSFFDQKVELNNQGDVNST